MTYKTDSLIETLQVNGYVATVTTVAGIEHVYAAGSRADYFYMSPGDYASDTRQYMRAPTASIAMLEFVVRDASPLATKFIAELLEVVAPGDRLWKKYVRPLVRTTATTLHAIYQTDTANVGLYLDTPAHIGRRLFEHGLAFPDASEFSTVELRAHCGTVTVDGGVWLNDATPLTVKREALPMWNSDETSSKLRVVVDRFIAAGELREREPYRAPPPKPAFDYGSLDISADPRDWDAGDPRRQIPGVADEVRRLRAERGLKPWE